MISDDSILKKLPKVLDNKTKVIYDGIRHCFEMIEMCYLRIKNNSILLSELHISPTSNEEANCKNKLFYQSQLLFDAWGFIDQVHRWNELILAAKGIKRAIPKIEALSRTINDVKKLRNYIQHLRDGVPENISLMETQGYSLFGTVSWCYTISNSKCMVFSATAGVVPSNNYRKNIINPLGQKIELPAGMFHLEAFDKIINISQIYLNLKSLVQDLEKVIANSIESSAEKAIIGTEYSLKQALEPCLTDLIFFIEIGFRDNSNQERI